MVSKTINLLTRLDFRQSEYFSCSEENKLAMQSFLLDYLREVKHLQENRRPLSYYLQVSNEWAEENGQYEMCQIIKDILSPKENQNV